MLILALLLFNFDGVVLHPVTSSHIKHVASASALWFDYLLHPAAMTLDCQLPTLNWGVETPRKLQISYDFEALSQLLFRLHN